MGGVDYETPVGADKTGFLTQRFYTLKRITELLFLFDAIFGEMNDDIVLVSLQIHQGLGGGDELELVTAVIELEAGLRLCRR